MFRLSPALIAARLKGVLDAANAGAGNAAFRFYATPRPSVLGGHTDAPQAEVPLAKPCGVINGVVLTLLPLTPGMVLANGQPRWGELYSAGGVLLLDGHVTDMEGSGDIRIEGSATPEGDDSPMLYVGGLVYLGATALT